MSDNSQVGKKVDPPAPGRGLAAKSAALACLVMLVAAALMGQLGPELAIAGLIGIVPQRGNRTSESPQCGRPNKFREVPTRPRRS